MQFHLNAPGGLEWMTFLVFACYFVPLYFYIKMLLSLLLFIEPHNRKMPPGNIWFLLIPIVGSLYHFLIVSDIADSIKAEATEQNIVLEEERPAFYIGIIMCIFGVLMFMPQTKEWAGAGWCMSWIVYWYKISQYKKILKTESSYEIGSES